MSGFADDLADSTDWLNTPLSGLAPLESGLRCQVCKDFFTTPMMTSCSHTFCSLCIRRYLSQEGRCPACRESDQEVKLRRNWAVEELVAHFVQARDAVLAFARKPPPAAEINGAERPKKRRRIEAPKSLPERRSTRSQSKKVILSASQASLEEVESTQDEVADSADEGSEYGPSEREQASNKIEEPHDGLVACPCCHRRMKEASINAHLDRCIQGLPTSPDPPVSQAVTNGHAPSAHLSYTQRTESPLPAARKDRLPTINYVMYSDSALRKKLKELGIPSHGNKELMRKRHTEWMNLWNANCDSLQPKSKGFLLKELDTWERTLGRQLEKGVTSSTSGVMVKDFDRDNWAKCQKGEFDDLIKKAREQRKAAAKPANQEEDTRSMRDVPMTDNPGEIDEASAQNPSDDSTSKTAIEQELTSLSHAVGSTSTSQYPTEGVNEPPNQRDVVVDVAKNSGFPIPAIGSIEVDLTTTKKESNEQEIDRQRSRFFA